MKEKLFLLIIYLVPIALLSQEVNQNKKFYILWGYNRSSYTLSNIHLKGEGYDFTIKQAKANDNPANPDFSTYLKPSSITVPQFNFKVGMFINENWSIAVGTDHMKYIMSNDQERKVDGYISREEAGKYMGTYNDSIIPISSDFLRYEHTDGLNYAYVELNYHDLFWYNKNHQQMLSFNAGVALGGLVPKTNARFFNTYGNDAFHLAGGGISTNLGVRFHFFRKWFFHMGVKTGWIYLPNVATNVPESDEASQNFFFVQYFGSLGYSFGK